MQTLHFSVDSALLRELGEKLVETVHLALVELVKNSYDADATQVEIIFDQNENGDDQIRIIDNGRGMNFEAVEKYWMRIATTNKEKSSRSIVFGRPLTGAKGIGRFAARRLGSHLKLVTYGTKSGSKIGIQKTCEYTTVDFPWAEFDPGTDVTDIECVGDQQRLSNKATGTTLIISNISSHEWNTRGFHWLTRQLAVLAANRGIKRAGFEEDPGFSVKITAPDFTSDVRDLRDDLMEAGWGTLTAHINSKHQAVCELDALGIGKKSIISTIPFKHLKDINLKIAIMVDDRAQMRNTSIISKGTLEQILPEWGGVQVRYRNFRVYPYGDDDWLDIDRDRGLRRSAPKNPELFQFAQRLQGVDASRSILNMLSMRSYVGNVNIGEKATGFEMKLNREGFLSSPAVDELKAFVRFAIEWTTILRDFYIRQQERRASLIATQELEKLINERIEPIRLVDTAVRFIEQEVETITKTLPQKDREQISESIFKATDAIRKHNESNKSELLHLRLVASTSTLLLIFSHEVKSLLGLLENSKNSLNLIKEKLNGIHRKGIEDIVNNFEALKNRLDELLSLTSLVGVDYRKAKAGNVALKDRIIKVINVFSLITNKYDIDIDYSEVPNNAMVKNILEAELYSILLNVLSNAIKSVIAAGNNKRIKIKAKRDDGHTKISVLDNGIGIAEENYEEVFIPFISDPQGKLYSNLERTLNPEDNLIVGSGSGLGLGIVKEIVAAHNGNIKFIKPSKGWKAEIEITLP